MGERLEPHESPQLSDTTGQVRFVGTLAHQLDRDAVADQAEGTPRSPPTLA